MGLDELEEEARFDPTKRMQHDALRAETRVESYRMDMLLEGADPDARVSTEGRSTDYTQYYTHDVLDVHTYRRITYHEVYPGIDWVLYTTEEGIKYDFVVRPGADPARIMLRFLHHEELRVEADGCLTHGNRWGRFTEAAPVCYQNGHSVGTRFVLQEDHQRPGQALVHFDLDPYDRSSTLRIDPARIWGTGLRYKVILWISTPKHSLYCTPACFPADGCTTARWIAGEQAPCFQEPLWM